MTKLGYFDTPVNETHYLNVDGIHQLYIEECGNPKGTPVVFLHGGPGGAISETSRRFFDPSYYRIILFDQRGSGKSKPFLSLQDNTILHSVGDMEKIRQYLQIDEWLVFGGSYGSTLALAYAIHYPEKVTQLILRGIFLGRQSDIDWLFKKGASEFYPIEFSEFKSHVPLGQQHDLVKAYYQLMMSDDEAVRNAACLAWSQWEGGIVKMNNQLKLSDEPSEEEAMGIQPHDLSLGLLEAHYFVNQMFWKDNDYILNRVHQLQQVPITIFHGRYDVDCRVSGAYDLKQACPHADLNIVEMASHSPSEGPLFDELVTYMDSLKN